MDIVLSDITVRIEKDGEESDRESRRDYGIHIFARDETTFSLYRVFANVPISREILVEWVIMSTKLMYSFCKNGNN